MIEKLIALNWNCASKREDFRLFFVVFGVFFSPGLADSPATELHKQKTMLLSSKLRFAPSPKIWLAWKELALRVDPIHSTSNRNIKALKRRRKKEESQG